MDVGLNCDFLGESSGVSENALFSSLTLLSSPAKLEINMSAPVPRKVGYTDQKR